MTGAADAAEEAEASATVSVDGLPTSFGVFKPAGYGMMGLPTQRQSEVLAGFGSGVTLLRRYPALAKSGYRWLLVKVDDGQHAGCRHRGGARLWRGAGDLLPNLYG